MDNNFKDFWENAFRDEDGNTFANARYKKQAENLADMLYIQYSAFVDAGFDEEAALVLISTFIASIVESSK